MIRPFDATLHNYLGNKMIEEQVYWRSNGGSGRIPRSEELYNAINNQQRNVARDVLNLITQLIVNIKMAPRYGVGR